MVFKFKVPAIHTFIIRTYDEELAWEKLYEQLEETDEVTYKYFDIELEEDEYD